LPDESVAAADSLARRLGISRGRLIANAVADYVAKHDTSSVTKRLDEVYGKHPGEADVGLRCAQHRQLRDAEW
jgi:hypothetical protein